MSDTPIELAWRIGTAMETGIENVLAEGHGGGNWRRLVVNALATIRNHADE